MALGKDSINKILKKAVTCKVNKIAKVDKDENFTSVYS